jgi:hypothetical protein
VQLKAGIPTIAIRDLSIQERENDLVVASFGRGIYILDNYSPLRELTQENLKQEAKFCQVKDTWQFITTNPLGYAAKGQQGDAFFTAENPAYGAVFTYYLKDNFVSLKDQRIKREKERIKKGENPGYPTWEDLKKEELEVARKVYFEVRDSENSLICRLNTPTGKGLHRIAWNLKYPSNTATPQPQDADHKNPKDPFADQTKGYRCIPGTYSAAMFIEENHVARQIGETRSFEIKTLGKTSFPAKDQKALLAFRKSAADLESAMKGLIKIHRETSNNVALIEELAFTHPSIPSDVREKTRKLKEILRSIEESIRGNTLVASHNEATLPGLASRIEFMASASQGSLSTPTQTQTETFDMVKNTFIDLLNRMKQVRSELNELNGVLEKSGAPWTPGRVPLWPAID